MMSVIEEIVRDLLIFAAVVFALLIVLVFIVSKMPADNPLKRVLSALSYRVGATLTAGIVAVPVEPIPGLDVIYDIAVPILLFWYWLTFLRDAIPSSPTSESAHTVTPLRLSRPLSIDTEEKVPKPTR